MKKSYTLDQVQNSSSPQRAMNVLAASFLLLATLTGTFSGKVQAQCSLVETGDITGNVPYGSSINWANPNRVEISDDLYARTSLNALDTTKYLHVRDFGYTLPITATILGIEVNIECHQETMLTDARDASIRLTKTGTPIGSDYKLNTPWSDKDVINTYGGATDLWGTTWTPTEIMSTDFGVLYSVTRLSGADNEYVNVDYVTVTVYYSDASCTLPITMKTFTVKSTATGTVQLDWITSSESGNSRFDVERSVDGTTFMPIGSLDGSGSSTTDKQYAFEDQEPIIGTNLYRLRQVDFDGKSTLTEVRAIELTSASTLTLNTYPSPATELLSIDLGTETSSFNARLLDLQGRVVQSVTGQGSKAQMHLATLPAGIYVLQVETGQQAATTKIIKR